MKDSEILGSGNSRYMKSAISETATWEEFRAMLRAGTFPFDFNGINEAGFTQVGDALNKNNLLKDATAALLGGDSSMVPDEALVVLKLLADKNSEELSQKTKVIITERTGTGETNTTNGAECSLTFDDVPDMVVAIDGSDARLGNDTSTSRNSVMYPKFLVTATDYSGGSGEGFANGGNCSGRASSDRKTIYWKSFYSNAAIGLNTAGVTYTFAAFYF